MSEATCPFCAAPFDDAFRTEGPRRRAPTGRLTRAAMFALGAGGLVAGAGAVSCASSSSGSGVPVDSYDDASSLPVDAAADAAPRALDAAGVSAADAVADATPEASTVAEASTVDSGDDAPKGPCGGSFCAMYGAPAIGH